MILPMTGFFLLLAMAGGFVIRLGGSNPRAAERVPLAFSMLCAGLGYCVPALVLYPLAFYAGTVVGFVLLFFAPFACGLSGAMYGYRAGLRRTASERA
jgi:hypothetical protein